MSGEPCHPEMRPPSIHRICRDASPLSSHIQQSSPCFLLAQARKLHGRHPECTDVIRSLPYVYPDHRRLGESPAGVARVVCQPVFHPTNNQPTCTPPAPCPLFTGRSQRSRASTYSQMPIPSRRHRHSRIRAARRRPRYDACCRRRHCCSSSSGGSSFHHQYSVS